MTDPADIQRYYDDYSDWYESERTTAYYGLINEIEIAGIRDVVVSADVLEVGCGPGLILETVAEMSASAAGVDLSPGMVQQAKAKGLDVREASATELPFPDDSFDVVYAFKSLPHVPDINLAIAEVHRVLRPGGIAFLEFYNPVSLKFVANKVCSMLRRRPAVYIRYDSIRDVRSMVESRFQITGMRGVRIFAPFRWAYTWPVARQLFSWLEWRYCDHPTFSRFGGYLVFVLRPISNS